jgi:serine phosphatase RsbU (regulator of sigma subunit)
LRDSADNKNASNKMLLLEAQVEREKFEKIQHQKALEKAKQKEAELSSTLKEKNQEVLEQEKMIDTKDDEIKIKDISLEEKEQKVARQKKWIIFFVIGLIGVVAYAFLLFRMYKNKKETNKLLTAQNEEIRQQKEEILTQRDEIINQRDEITAQKDEIEASRDLVLEQKQHIEHMLHEVNQSIDYAQRIQATVLPEESFLEEHFDSHFILYKPKDVVSGDFYWCAHVEGQIIVAVADCTGHGVPGAFMSMLGTSFLREIVQKEYITDPAVILRKLRKEIIKALKQKGIEGEHKDGMDIALVSINKKTKLVHYAGANNSLLYIRNSDMKDPSGIVLNEIKADKMPIAIFDQMVNFTNHEIQLQSGDMIYMFSDGYADQFGGPKSKKYLSRNFRKLITETCKKSMVEQKVTLDVTIEQWKKGHIAICEQTDDITVVGLKI